jgi:large subunit ribosomal protein L40
MSFSLLSKRYEHLPLRVSATSVRHAGRKEALTDPKKEILRRLLYPANIRNRPNPVGTWRADVSRVLQRAIPSVQAHETIERAWLLHKRHTRWKRNAELERKFEFMRKAMAELEVVDPRSFAEANRSEDPRARSIAEVELAKTLRGPERRAVEARIRGLFPREMRPPPDTPTPAGWNYDWKPIVPLTARESSI